MIDCIIFDLDGTLVDSEPLCNQAFLNLLPEISLSVDDLLVRFRGRKLADIFCEIEAMTGRALPNNFEAAYREQVEILFKSSLRAFPDVHDVLKTIDIKVCIASSGPPGKIKSALEKTSLDRIFAGRTFSSYDIGKWKPDPGLFLHAAAQMGTSPEFCLVVEDSPVGIAAAKSAGMMPLQFCDKTSAMDGVESFDAYSEFAQKLSWLSKCQLQKSNHCPAKLI
ncbi:MAG: HAD-IA family hydrolase [Cohaesibacteraceae bacterium]|nr:HAD-IA family hydrolase [Cohaesibacteraceae bacterium]